MGDWLPDARVFTQDRTRVVYYWVIPANFSGTWQDDTGGQITIRQHYQLAELQVGEAAAQTTTHDLRINGSQLNAKQLGLFEISGETLTLTRPGQPQRKYQRKPGSSEPLIF